MTKAKVWYLVQLSPPEDVWGICNVSLLFRNNDNNNKHLNNDCNCLLTLKLLLMLVVVEADIVAVVYLS